MIECRALEWGTKDFIIVVSQSRRWFMPEFFGTQLSSAKLGIMEECSEVAMSKCRFSSDPWERSAPKRRI